MSVPVVNQVKERPESESEADTEEHKIDPDALY
jgi:hypothetical protein